MPNQPFSPRLAMLALLIATAACADLPTTTTASSDPSTNETVAVALDEMSVEASLQGDAAAATDYADGALAIRLGATPTEIAVQVDGQDYRYWAVAIGIIERAGSGPELLRRAVVAWTGSPRPTSAFRVMARSDQAQFGRHDAPSDAGRATGTFVDLERRARYAAVDGSLATALGSVASACPVAEQDPRFECHLARFSMRLDGTFEFSGDAVVRLPVFSEAGSIAGVVVRRTDGGSGGRPTTTAQPSRPQPTRG